MIGRKTFGYVKVVPVIRSLACGSTDGRPVCPRSLLHVLEHVVHGLTYVGKGGINEVIRSQWFAPGITQISQTLVNRCMTSV